MSPPRRSCRGPFSRGAEAAAVSAFGQPRISASGFVVQERGHERGGGDPKRRAFGSPPEFP